ncbi:MAG: hypothetical protein ABR887_07835 [Methanoregulaceae archaeon]
MSTPRVAMAKRVAIPPVYQLPFGLPTLPKVYVVRAPNRSRNSGRITHTPFPIIT